MTGAIFAGGPLLRPFRYGDNLASAGRFGREMPGDDRTSAAASRAWLDRMAGSHLANLTHRQGEVLVLEALGLSEAAIATRLSLRLRTVQHHAREAHWRVIPSGADATRSNGQLWSYLHLRCCLAPQWTELVGDAESKRISAGFLTRLALVGP